jgi:hypothetical protein
MENPFKDQINFQFTGKIESRQNALRLSQSEVAVIRFTALENEVRIPVRSSINEWCHLWWNNLISKIRVHPLNVFFV